MIWRFPKSWGTPKSSKSLDNFSIETYGFGGPPFSETPIYRKKMGLGGEYNRQIMGQEWDNKKGSGMI
jgi:hypothetical protein